MQPAKILVADDEQNLRRVLAALLRRDGHEVVQAANGLEAIDRLSDVDVVITDLRMPGADGMEVLRTANKNHPHVPVIMITAYGSVGAGSSDFAGAGVGSLRRPPVSVMSSIFATGSAAGKNTLNVEPWPIGERTSIVPPCWLMMRWLIARPRPVPFCFVVQNGMNSFFKRSRGMPTPESRNR